MRDLNTEETRAWSAKFERLGEQLSFETTVETNPAMAA
jgi:hypothetical protein